MMRRAAEISVRPGSQKSVATSMPAPIGGLNARDSIANMKAEDAVVLENWFPRTTSVDVRKGFTAWNTFTGVCQTVMIYSGATAKVFPCVKNGSTYSIFDGTSAGALSSPVVGGSGPTVQALTSTRFDYVNFGTTGGQFLSAVNGADVPLQFDGTTWTASTMSGGSSTPANFFTVAVYQRRLWYGVKNTFDVYYNAADTISGSGLTKLNLGPLFKDGGTLNSIITVTDNSNALADYIGFMSTEGEIVAFTGTDPASASTWTLAAHFRVGRPVTKGNRCWEKWGSDALILCADGVYPIRRAIVQEEKRGGGLAVSEKIRNLINSDIAIHGTRQGWQITVHPTGGKLIVNVPTAEDVGSYQYVMNTQTQAWCKYTGWAAMSFGVTTDTLYMGMSGKMVKADVGADDGGAAIMFYGKQAFNYFGSRGYAKHLKMVRPILEADGTFTIAPAIAMDYGDAPNTAGRTIAGGTGDPWGGIWDASWGGGASRSVRWYGVTGVGHAVSMQLNGQVDGSSLSWSATDVVYERGGILG